MLLVVVLAAIRYMYILEKRYIFFSKLIDVKKLWMQQKQEHYQLCYASSRLLELKKPSWSFSPPCDDCCLIFRSCPKSPTWPSKDVQQTKDIWKVTKLFRKCSNDSKSFPVLRAGLGFVGRVPFQWKWSLSFLYLCLESWTRTYKNIFSLNLLYWNWSSQFGCFKSFKTIRNLKLHFRRVNWGWQYFYRTGLTT